jgi:hypothetical protein
VLDIHLYSDFGRSVRCPLPEGLDYCGCDLLGIPLNEIVVVVAYYLSYCFTWRAHLLPPFLKFGEANEAVAR